MVYGSFWPSFEQSTFSLFSVYLQFLPRIYLNFFFILYLFFHLNFFQFLYFFWLSIFLLFPIFCSFTLFLPNLYTDSSEPFHIALLSSFTNYVPRMDFDKTYIHCNFFLILPEPVWTRLRNVICDLTFYLLEWDVLAFIYFLSTVEQYF